MKPDIAGGTRLMSRDIVPTARSEEAHATCQSDECQATPGSELRDDLSHLDRVDPDEVGPWSVRDHLSSSPCRLLTFVEHD